MKARWVGVVRGVHDRTRRIEVRAHTLREARREVRRKCAPSETILRVEMVGTR